MAQFAQYNRVIYVNYAYTYKDVLAGALGKNTTPISKVLGMGNRLESRLKFDHGELFILYPPPVLPTNWIKNDSTYRYWQNGESNKIAKSINKAQKVLGFKNPILINAFNPQFGLGVLGSLNEDLSVYYCYDEINAASWCKEHGRAMEVDFLKKVDAVVCTSESLKANKEKVNPNAFLVKNGVDHGLFQQAIKKDETSQKVVGYIGSLDDRVDYNLLQAVAEKYSDCRLKLIGRIMCNEAKALASTCSNVELTGSKQPNELVSELKEVDLGLIPFVTNEFTKNVYPLKVNEYLAAGKPVVSTHFADLAEFDEQIAICGTSQSFLSAIEGELQGDTPEKQQERSIWAKQNSWQNRAEQFSSIIYKLSERKYARA